MELNTNSNIQNMNMNMSQNRMNQNNDLNQSFRSSASMTDSQFERKSLMETETFEESVFDNQLLKLIINRTL